MRTPWVMAPLLVAVLAGCTSEPKPVSASSTGELWPGLDSDSARANRDKYPPLTATVTATPVPANEVTLMVRARDGDGEARIEVVHWGDGETHRPVLPTPSCAPSIVPRPFPSTMEEELRHTYADDGTYTVRVIVVSGAGICRSREDLEPERAELVLKVRVAD